MTRAHRSARKETEAVVALCLRARAGDDHAAGMLVRCHKREIAALCVRLGIPDEEAGDYTSLAWEAMRTPIRRFDAARGVRFWSYAYHFVRGRIIDRLGQERHLTGQQRCRYRRVWLAFEAYVAARESCFAPDPCQLSAEEVEAVIAVFRARNGFGVLPKTVQAVLSARRRCVRLVEGRGASGDGAVMDDDEAGEP